jgi:hypothetical protein
MFWVMIAIITMPYTFFFSERDGSGIAAGFANFYMGIVAAFSLLAQMIVLLVIVLLFFLLY